MTRLVRLHADNSASSTQATFIYFYLFFSSGCNPTLQKPSYIAFLHRHRCLKNKTSDASDTMRLILKQRNISVSLEQRGVSGSAGFVWIQQAVNGA